VQYIANIAPENPGPGTSNGALCACREGDIAMVKNFEDFQMVGKEGMDSAMKSWGVMSKGAQAIAVEVADYSKKAFEEGSAALEKLFGVKSFDKVIEVQTEYAKTAYESFVAEATKLSELYADLAKETYKPFEGIMPKAK
jgi:hypothetical protein